MLDTSKLLLHFLVARTDPLETATSSSTSWAKEHLVKS